MLSFLTLLALHSLPHILAYPQRPHRPPAGGVSSGAIGPSSSLVIANKVISPDGFNRSAVLAGASASSLSFPGPVVRGYKGDHFAMNVIDQLTDTTMLRSTSIHWHGIFQRGSAYADGPVGVTQCPITPGNSFLYDFRVPDQAGTFWYHSHYLSQYCDGLRGAFVGTIATIPTEDSTTSTMRAQSSRSATGIMAQHPLLPPFLKPIRRSSMERVVLSVDPLLSSRS